MNPEDDREVLAELGAKMDALNVLLTDAAAAARNIRDRAQAASSRGLRAEDVKYMSDWLTALGCHLRSVEEYPLYPGSNLDNLAGLAIHGSRVTDSG